MGSPAPESRIRAKYGSVKDALEWCAYELKLGIAATAQQLEVDRKTVRRWRDNFEVIFPAKKDMNPTCKGSNPKVIEWNQRRKGNVLFNGRRWYTGEPTWYYVKEIRNGK